MPSLNFVTATVMLIKYQFSHTIFPRSLVDSKCMTSDFQGGQQRNHIENLVTATKTANDNGM